MRESRPRPPTSPTVSARYQKCRLVRDLALSLGIELLFLPTYSPNLNLIERLWKFVKKQCLYSIYYNDFAVFKQAISALSSRCIGTREKFHHYIRGLLMAPRGQGAQRVCLDPRQTGPLDWGPWRTHQYSY